VRVDQVAWYLKPLYWLYSYGLGYLLIVWFWFTRLSCRVELVGAENFAPYPSCIMAMWHTENVPCFASGFFRRTGKRYALINHPTWFMRPTHLLLYALGVERLVLGSTGHEGRRAANEVVGYLKQGWSTHINPDGPAGPRGVLKKGVAHLASQAHVPIIPVKFTVSRQLVLPRTWDPKRIPLPFSKIKIIFGKPIWVSQDDLDAQLPIIRAALM